MIEFEARCCDTSFKVETKPDRTSGYLQCPKCQQIMPSVSIAPWKVWLHELALIHAQQLHDRSYPRGDSRQFSVDGAAAELAACLILCPGHIEDYRELAASTGRNIGKDLLGAWIGYQKDFEIKWTQYCSENAGILFVRRPVGQVDVVPSRDLVDSIYVLLHGTGEWYRASCWADRELLLKKGERNPKPMPVDGNPTWGAHWKKLYPFQSITSRLGLLPIAPP